MSSDDDAWNDGGEPVAAISTCGDDTSTFVMGMMVMRMMVMGMLVMRRMAMRRLVMKVMKQLN